MLPVDKLLQLAIAARERAYAPYSKYKVGAVIETSSGSVYTGVNVENLSYGATICAERTAVVKMVSEELGGQVVQIAVASEEGVMPCGICLQVLEEFVAGPAAMVHCGKPDGSVRSFRFEELLPHAFESNAVKRT